LPGTLTLNGNGNPNAVWIFQIGSTLTTASSSRVVLSNGARPSNVFWAVGSSATLGTGTRFAGNILALASITLTTGADLFGRALALNGAVTMDTNRISALCPGPPCSADPPSAVVAPNLGAAAGFSVLGAATVTNTGATIVGGDLGVSPGSAITGFNSSNAIVGPGTVTDGPGLVTGTIHAGDTAAAQAQAAAAIAYGDLAGRACNVTYGEVAELGGLNLAPGVHCFPSSAFVTGTLTLNGSANSIWVFKIASTLVTAVNSSVVMGNEAAQDANVFWAVGSSATLGTGTRFRGNIIAHTSITLTTGANVSGRALALNGAVTMDTNNISAVCAGGRCLPAPFSRPAVSQVIVDNYQCDEAKLDKGSPRPRRNVVVTDELGTREVMLDRPLLVCSPATVQSGATAALAVRNTIDRLVCYDFIERGSLDSERREVSVDNAVFEPRRLRVKKPKLVCLSSLQTLLDDSDD
jgi:hypothetical protein